ncbi:MAG TPA: thiamine-phosphate kinase [Candidatus Aminicenantes bacterium]|nr:thiamine-phosphate kinase [Candidatus Aminicenantes bacterium]
MDEEQLVRFLQRKFSFPNGRGIGDDASAQRINPSATWGSRIVAKDLFVEGTHFNLHHYSLAQAAEKSVGANVSDMAAMGGRGMEIYLGLGVPSRARTSDLEAVFSGIHKACRRWRLRLGGGDVSKAPCWFFSVTILGHALRPVFRDRAQDGDLIGLVGRIGESALGLALLQRNTPDSFYTRRHIQVNLHLGAAEELGRVASAMIDVSDGLLKDLSRILSASQVGAEIHIENLPITRRMKACCRQHDLDAQQLALTGGEDYALLCCIPPQRLKLLKGNGERLRIIGRIRSSPQRLTCLLNGRTQEIPAGGYDHLSNNLSDSRESPEFDNPR